MTNPPLVNGSRTARPAALPLSLVADDLRDVDRIHDDVLDEADVRRHLPTVNAAFGPKTSLLLGDMLFSAAFRLCSTVDAQACEWIGEATNRVCAGELRQVSEAGNLDLSEADYFEIVAGKTGALTECCTRLGAHYAGADPDVVERLAAYGRDLGIAFQIADDVLDLGGDPFQTGKTLGTDVEQRKLTLPVIRALADLPEPEAARLRTALGRGSAADVGDILTAAGSVEAAEREARRHATAARRALTVVPASPYRTALEHLTEWVVRRGG